jgi:hypothetical protein
MPFLCPYFLIQHTLSEVLISCQLVQAIHNIDITLISETHFTEKTYLKLPNYTVYHTNHPARTVRGGAAIIKKNPIITKEDSVGLLTISTVYLPPKYTVKQGQLEDF